MGFEWPSGRQPGRVRGMVMKQVGVMLAWGGAIGLTTAVWVGTLVASLLFEMKGWDPAVLASATVGLSIVALVGGFHSRSTRIKNRPDARAQVRIVLPKNSTTEVTD